jgi:hypothetical protein
MVNARPGPREAIEHLIAILDLIHGDAHLKLSKDSTTSNRTRQSFVHRSVLCWRRWRADAVPHIRLARR